MSNPDHHYKLLRSIPDWNEWRRLNPQIKPDLSHISLAKARLVGADLHDADLMKTVLQEADLTGANLEDANLQGAVV